MKRKLKVFLNNRVISTAISAAITFNMAALFPMCVFAKDDDSTHTNTVDFSEIKIDGKVMSNGYIAFNVENNGHFAIGTTGGDPDNSKDNNKKMLFGFSSGSTSYSTLRVDGTSYTIYASNNSFNADEANNVSEATYNDVNVQQVLSLTDNPATGRADLIEIRYVVTNESETEKNVGLRIMMDTMLGDNDSAPFRIPQYGAITTETEYTGDEIPQFWQAFDNLTSPSVVAQGRLYQIEEDKPDKVQFCNWRGLSNCNWEYTVHPGSGNGDSGVAMTWYEAPLAPYESKTYVTYYGLSEFSEDMSLPLGLSVYSDSELSVINSQYAPNPVDVTAYVQNLSSSTAEDVKVSIELPDGLQLTNNTEQTIDVGNMTPNQLEQTAWSVFVNPSNQEQTYEYTVVLTAADGYEKRVSRRIHVPALKIEEVSPYTLFSGSSTENFQLNCWKSTFNGNVYTGASFVSNASELYLNGKVDAVNTITTNGWQININERNENVDKEAMPDWDARIHKMAGAYEFTDEDVVRIQDKNVMDGAVKTTGKAEISGTTFDGNCYIIADGDITYNVNDFISTGRVVLYSRNGNITINGTNIDMNGIMYAPNGTVAFNSNIANINGRIFADKINFSGSIFNVTGSDSDWELLGTKSVISKTYTLDDDFKEGEFDGLGLDVADELTLDQRSDNDNVSSENSYKIDSAANGIGMTVKSDKSSLDKPEDSVNLEFDLGGFGSQEIEENNVDLAIVVDTSGSMGGSRKTNAQNAAREVVAQMKENDRCAIIKFTSSATVLQDFTDDYELLDTAINKLGASGGTNIASGINKAISCFGNLEDNSRQKYIILLSDGSDSSKSAQAASDAYALGIRIFALSIGNDSNQMQTVAANSNGIYLNSPTAEQINEMMQQFAAEVFDTAGKDVSFEMTVSKKAGIDASAINPQPTEIIENEDGTKTLKWSYEKISIDENQIITVPVSVNDLKAGLFNIADNVSCTYFNRNGKSSTVYADDIVMPVHSYKESGVWTAVYDSKTVDTVWKNIYWNGKLYDDGKIVVKACAGNDENAFGDWVDITNYADIENLSGRYIKLSVEMNVSSTGKTPEIFDITVLSDGSDNVNYINNAPETKIVGSDTTCVSKRLFLSSATVDDSFCTQLDFKWSCDNENVIISNSNKPYASFKFNESGEYTVTLTVSDGNSETVVSKTITVLNDEFMVIPIIDIESPSVVKVGSVVIGRINIINGAQIAEYEIKVGNESVTADEDGNFTFTAPENDCIIAINVKAANVLGLYGESSKAIVVDGTAPSAELRSDSDEIHANDTVTVSVVMSDENGIKDYIVTLNGEEITLNENYQYIFTPETAGEYVFVLTAEDIAGNTSNTTLVLNVFEEEFKDTNQPVVKYSVPKILMAGESGDFRFIASDDTGVAEFTVKVNGVAVVIDENGYFSYVPEETGNLLIGVHAVDEAGNNTDFQLTVPVISLDLVTEKTTYKENEIVTVQLAYSDNLNIIDQQAAIDGVQMTIENDKISAEGLSVGSHQVVWQVQDECGAVFTGTLEIEVIDSTAPEVSVTLSDNNPKEGDSVTAEITASDEYGIASVIAKLDGNEITLNESKAILENLTAGKHTIEITATDTTGNYTVYTYDFTVLNNQLIDTTAPELDVTVEFTEDKNIEIIATATDDSGNAAITGTVNGEEVVFENGKAVYTPTGVGDYVIIIRAEDESGNYTEKTQTVTITKEDTVFELKLGVTVEKDNIKPGETTNLIVSTSSVLGEVSLSCTANGGTVTENENGFSFVSDKAGTFELVVTATDKKGNTASQTVYITVTAEKIDIGDDDEETGNYENKYTPEPRARVILDSNEKTETKMTEEMADLADHLETPLAVYEYLYNNVNTEFYKGSRKGAIGTYEQNGGNDVDCASLLIALLRYMGYEAEYVTGTVGVTEQQLIDLTAADNIETALKIFMIQGKEVSKSADMYYFDHTWVKTTIDAKEYDLDISFKKYRQVESIYDEIEKQNIDVDISNFNNSSDFYLYLSKFDDQSSEEISVNVTGKIIVQKKISNFPLKLPYICGIIKGRIYNIYDSEIVDTDIIRIGMESGRKIEITSPKAYVSSITISYTPNSQLYKLMDEPVPRSIYDLKNDYLASYYDVISPALYIDNELIFEWGSALTSIGDTQTLYIETVSSGVTHCDTKEVLVGSVNCISTDNQNISAQSLLTAYEKMPLTDDEQSKVNESNVYNDKYIGNFLSLIGMTYFTQLDIENKVLAGANRIYAERYLSYGVFSYEPCVLTSSLQNEIQKKGSFSVDILGNYASTVSYKNNCEDEYAYRFASGYVSSYLESLVLEQYTGGQSVSTAEVLRISTEQGINIKMISSKNAEEIDNLQLSATDIEDIRSAVNSGKLVVVPEKNISVGDWTGTGYIIQNADGSEFDFKLSNGLNGAYSTFDLTAYLLIITIFQVRDMSQVLLGLAGIMASLLMSPLGIFSAIGVAAVFIAAVSVECVMCEDYKKSVDLYFAALDGDVDAANMLNAKAFFAVLGYACEPAMDKAVGAILDNKLTQKIVGWASDGKDFVLTRYSRYKKLTSSGYSSSKAAKIMQYSNVEKMSDDLLEAFIKSDCGDDILESMSKYSDDVYEALNKFKDKDTLVDFITKHGDDGAKVAAKGGDDLLRAVKNLDDDAAESFIKTASKQDDAFFEAIAKSSDPDKATAFVAKYTDDGAEIITKYGDDAVTAVNNCDSPYKAIQIIKNGGTQYGEQAVQAIKKSGDKAVEALTKVPTKDCAELIVKYGDDAAAIVTKYGDSAIQAAAKCSTPDMTADAVRLMKDNTRNTVEAISNYGDDAVQALNNVSTSYQSKCSKYIVDYGDDAVDVFTKHGNDAYNALGKCSDSYKKDAITFMNTEEGVAVRYINRNGDAGVESLSKYAAINPETGVKNGWNYVTDPLPDNFRDTCINKDLAGKTHPQTGVPFEERTVILGGKESQVVVPRFDSQFDATLPDDLIKLTDAVQFSECNAQLKETLAKNPELKKQFNAEQLTQIEKCKTPDGYTWHHDAEIGKLQLVDQKKHKETGHTGGRKIWGDGDEAR